MGEAYFGAYGAYIVPAYGASALVILAMIVLAWLRYRRQLREIASLERQGVTRRSSAGGKAGT